MSTDPSLIQKVQPYTSVFGTAFSIGKGIYSIVDDKKQWDQVNRKLDQILKNQEVMLKRLDAIFTEVEWATIMTLIGNRLLDIRSWSNSLLTYSILARNDPEYQKKQGTKDAIETWAREVFEHCGRHLDAIHDVMMGNLTGNKSLMEIVASRVKNEASQAQYYNAVTFFQSLLLLQQQALVCLGNAYKYRNPESTLEDINQALDPYVKKGGRSTFLVQANYASQFLNDLSKYWDSPGSYLKEGNEFVAFGISTSDGTDVVRLIDIPTETLPGCVIVGARLAADKFNRSLGIRCAQAPINTGVVGGDSWIGGYAVKEDLYAFSPRFFGKGDPESYLNLRESVVPVGEVVTGMRLRVLNQRLSVQLQSAKLGPEGNLDDASRHWNEADSGGSTEGTDFAVIRKRAKYISLNQVLPTPFAPIRGAKLFFYDDGNAYFVNLKLKSGIYDIEDTWDKYSVASLLTE